MLDSFALCTCACTDNKIIGIDYAAILRTQFATAPGQAQFIQSPNFIDLIARLLIRLRDSVPVTTGNLSENA